MNTNPFLPHDLTEDLEYKVLCEAVFSYLSEGYYSVCDEEQWVEFVSTMCEEQAKEAFRKDRYGVEHGLRVMWQKGRYTDPRTQLDYDWQDWDMIFMCFGELYNLAAKHELEKNLLLREIDGV